MYGLYMVFCVSKTDLEKRYCKMLHVLVEYGLLRFKERFRKSFNMVFAVVGVGWAIRNIRVRIRLTECRIVFLPLRSVFCLLSYLLLKCEVLVGFFLHTSLNLVFDAVAFSCKFSCVSIACTEVFALYVLRRVLTWFLRPLRWV